jgi:hypothetical protein
MVLRNNNWNPQSIAIIFHKIFFIKDILSLFILKIEITFKISHF